MIGRGIGEVARRAVRSYTTKAREAASASPKPQQSARPSAGKADAKGAPAQKQQQPQEVLSARGERLVTALTWASCASVGVYLICLHDWKGDTVFSDIKPGLRKAVTALHKSE